MSVAKVKAIDIDSLRSLQTLRSTPRSAREVAERKLRAELRGDTGSRKTGQERDEDLAEFYLKKKEEKLAAEKLAKQKKLLANPTASLIECACGGAARVDDLQFLLSKGVDLDDVDPELDRSALMSACLYGAQAGVEALVRAGADVNLQNSSGSTALMCAVSGGHMGIVSFLVDHSGARPELVDHAGHSPVQVAYERGFTQIAAKLVRALAAPPARVTTVMRERQAEERRKQAEAALKAQTERREMMERTIREAKEEEEAELELARSRR